MSKNDVKSMGHGTGLLLVHPKAIQNREGQPQVKGNDILWTAPCALGWWWVK